MHIHHRCERLKKIYAVYDDFTAGTDKVCRKGCSVCCTCNVTATTLEGWLIYDRLAPDAENPSELVHMLVHAAPVRRFQPRVTINDMVALCVQGKELPEEENDPAAGNCPLIEDDLCPVYDVRPFGCRAMVSTVDCSANAEASMPPLILSANNVVMQFIEALDRPGASGNLVDILLFLNDPDCHRAYEKGQYRQWPRPLRPNQPFPALMIPPEHRQAIQPLVDALSMCSR